MKQYMLPEWQSILATNQLNDFEKLWNVNAELVEPLNKRRGGWSGVFRINVTLPTGEQRTLFLKRQQNHVYKPLAHFIRGAPTFRREMKNMKRFMKKSIAIAEPIYYVENGKPGDMRAILITASISPEYRPLDVWLEEWQKSSFPPIKEQREIARKIAYAIRRMHDHHIRHGALFAKHVFLKYTPGGTVAVRFIDLEKARYWFLPSGKADTDLHALHSSVHQLDTAKKLSFYKEYIKTSRLSKSNIGLLKKIKRRFAKRS
jgi:hypothetical protein